MSTPLIAVVKRRSRRPIERRDPTDSRQNHIQGLPFLTGTDVIVCFDLKFVLAPAAFA